MSVQLSPIDSERYEISIARATDVTQDTLPNILKFCHDNHVKMLIARCSTSHLATAQAMEQSGFLLMDTLVYYNFEYAKSAIPDNTSQAVIRGVQLGDEIDVEKVAREAFKDYYGHYHADSRLDKSKSDEAYISWAVRSCVSREVAKEVLIAEVEGHVAGFATLRMNSADEGEGVLFGVAPDYQGHGIYRAFMIHAMRWVQGQGAKRIIVSTQVNNIAVQKVWARLGFTMSGSYYTFHKWFDA